VNKEIDQKNTSFEIVDIEEDRIRPAKQHEIKSISQEVPRVLSNAKEESVDSRPLKSKTDRQVINDSLVSIDVLKDKVAELVREELK